MVTLSPAELSGFLPIPRTRLIGREQERTAARALLLDEAVPLLTLTGSGGSGKTRLALAVAQDVATQFGDGIAWIDLAPLANPALVPVAVATATGFIPMPGRSLDVELVRHLQPRQMLLLFDNCEHLLAETAELIAQLLSACPAVQVLATSRAPLHIRGEHVLPVEPLPLPPVADHSAEMLARNESVRLFVERAHAASPAFRLEQTNAATVAELCRQLDGLPLAIELAAARSPLLSPETLVAQMRDRLSVLRDGPRDAPARQQTIRAAITWSYDLLTSEEQALFRRLAVFSGGFTLETAQFVVGNDDESSAVLSGLGTLVDHNFVRRVEQPGEPRFAMLETIRVFGLERLAESNEDTETRNRHAACFLELVRTRDAWVAPYLPNFHQILDQLETEYPNLRAALAWQQETGDVSGLLELAGALNFFWQLRGRLRDGRAWLEWGLAQYTVVTPSARAMGQLGLSSMLYVQHDPVPALALCEEALRHYRDSGDTAGMGRASDHAACIALSTGDFELCANAIDAAIAALSALGDAPWARRAISHVRHYRGCLALWSGDVAEADRLIRDVIADQERLAHEEGAEHAYACWPLLLWAAAARERGVLDDALRRYQAALGHARRVQELRCTADAVAGVAGIMAMSDQTNLAAWLFGATEAFADRSGIEFFEETLGWQRDLGLPPSWKEHAELLTRTAGPRSTGHNRGLGAPPVPDPDAQFWVAGRTVPIEEAVTAALRVDLTTPTVFVSQRTHPPATRDAAHCLTPRERAVLALLCERLTDPQIAERLFLSPRTVESHVSTILGKLGVANRRDAAAMAVRLGLV